MNVPDAPALPILLSQETGFSEQRDNAPRNLRLEMKEIGRVMTDQVKEVFVLNRHFPGRILGRIFLSLRLRNSGS
jgi:hypothetical protein